MFDFLNKIWRRLRAITGGKPVQQDLISPKLQQAKATSFGADLVRVMREQERSTGPDSRRHPGGLSVGDFDYIHEPCTGGSSADVFNVSVYDSHANDCTAADRSQEHQCCGRCQPADSNVVHFHPKGRL